MQFNISTILVIAWCFSGAQAWIYATANVYGCVYFATKPINPIKVNFQTGIAGTQCMTQNGNGGEITVTQAGVSCLPFGEIQHKPYSSGGDNCAVRFANWGVSYSTSEGSSGSTSSYWSANYRGQLFKTFFLEGESPGTVLCGSQSRCSTTRQDWPYGLDPVPTYYMIFNPYSTARLSTSDLEDENGYIMGEAGNQTAAASPVSRVKRTAGEYKL